MIELNAQKQENIIYQELLENLNPDKILDFVNHHKKYQQPRLKRLNDYYSGQNVSILEAESRRNGDGSDKRLLHPFGREIADFQAGFSVGQPIGIDVDDSDNEDHDTLDQVNNTNDVDALYSDLFLDVGKYGRGYALTYRQDGYEYERIVRLDPENTFMIYNTDVDYKPIMAVRYVPVQTITQYGEIQQVNIEYNVETWTDEEHVNYQPIDLMVPNLTVANREPLAKLPVVEFWNNSLRIGDYENVISLIDAYDAAESDTANYMTDLNDAMLVIKGDIDNLMDGAELYLDPSSPDYNEQLKKQAEAKLEILRELKSANMLLLKSGSNALNGQTSVDAEFIHKEYDTTGVEAYKDRLYKDIHSLSRTPDVSDSNFAGNVSGVAMRYKQLGVIQQAQTKRRQFEKGLYALYEVVQTLEQSVSGAWNIDFNDIKFTFTDNLPVDDVETIQALVNAGAQFPQEYLWRFAPQISDTDELKEMMNEQRDNVNVEQTRLSKRDEAVANDTTGTDVPVQQGTDQSGQAPQQEANQPS